MRTQLLFRMGIFEELKETVNILGMNQGGKWRATALGSYYQNTCNFTINEPSNWASVNVKTCNANSSNINSWFVIPSTYNTTFVLDRNSPELWYLGWRRL